MCVDIGDNHFLADISYVPPAVYAKIRYVEFEGMRVVDPNYQKIDLHSSLSFPFDNAPREVVFARWESKDIQRYNKLTKYYPVVFDKKNVQKLSEIKAPRSITKYVLDGWLAYGAIYESLLELAAAAKEMKIAIDMSAAIIPSKFGIGADSITCMGVGHVIEIVHFDVVAAVREMGLKGEYHYAYFNMIPKHFRSAASVGMPQIVIKSTKHKFMSVHQLSIADVKLRIVSNQYVLMQFLCNYYIADDASSAETYLAAYNSLLGIINTAEQIFAAMIEKIGDTPEIRKLIDDSPFFPSIKVYGSDNYSEKDEIQFLRMALDMRKKVERPVLPVNYYPGRAHARAMNNAAESSDKKDEKKHPRFDYDSSKYFIKDGRVIADEGEDH
jgi:hypothetical protein